jgi:hypothetical protein
VPPETNNISEQPNNPESLKPKKRHQLFDWIKGHKLASAGIMVGLLIISAGVGMAAGLFGENNQAAVINVVKKEPPKPTTVASPLTGVQVTPEQAESPVVASIIENHPDARPQSGLGQAGVVYEALAEGGITRFLALFLETKPAQIGPIRSIRTYFVDWALEFNTPIAHVGGNIDALDMIGPYKVKSMNQFYNSTYYYRSSDRFAPHNVYTTADKLNAMLKAKGYDKPATFTPNARKKDSPVNPAANTTITVNYSTTGYQAVYTYDAATNDYARTMAGKPHIDRNTNQQIRVKNIVVQYMPTSYGRTRIGEIATRMATPGSGKIVVLRDGTAIEGTWSKASHTTRTKLLDAQGKEIPLNAGNTWYSIVPVGNSVTY